MAFTSISAIGMPTQVANYIPKGIEVVLQSEKRHARRWPLPARVRNRRRSHQRGKETVTELAGSSYFSSADSFGMIRGGHVDLTVLGALQVDEKGNLRPTWAIPGKCSKAWAAPWIWSPAQTRLPSPWNTPPATTKPQILKKCTLPLTGVEVVDHIVTELALSESHPKASYYAS